MSGLDMDGWVMWGGERVVIMGVCVWKNGGEEESSEGKKATGRKTRKRKTKNKSSFESKISKLNWIRKKKSMKNIEAVSVKIQQVEKVKTEERV